MQIRILGCFGGSAPEMHPPCYLAGERVAVDAGALTTGLSLAEQAHIRHVFLSHSHIDHVCTLPFLLDNIFNEIDAPVNVYGAASTISSLKRHLFNNELWPDFTKLSNPKTPILRLVTIRSGETLELEGLRITSAPMVHTVESFGYLLETGGGAAFLCGDTCSVDGALPLIGRAPGLEFVVLEASFPNRLQEVAELSRHLTCAGFAREAAKLPRGVRILATHMKPDCLGEIQMELSDLALDNVSLIEQGAAYPFGYSRGRRSD